MFTRMIKIMVMGIGVSCLACSMWTAEKKSGEAKVMMPKISGIQAKLLLVCYSEFEKTQPPEFAPDPSKFDVVFDEIQGYYVVEFQFHADGSNRAGGRSRWGRDVKFEISKTSFEIIGKKFFK